MDTKHTAIPEHSVPDYELDDQASLTSEQIKVLFDQTRLTIADLLGERAASVSQLARALDRPKGTIAHHITRMEKAGLVKVVRTRKVRAMEERFYGRTARTFLLHQLVDAGLPTDIFLRQALAELPVNETAMLSLRYARISKERAEEWSERLDQLMEEFVAQPRLGQQSYGLLVALYQTKRPTLEGFDM
ncbi:MAG TPA: winged helix-turn-helix domain-containing protein [Acidimicrobiia bacterium]|nr:winged helix-turn-helix domain-containing protein [Acidimicrobiia bacterium]